MSRKYHEFTKIFAGLEYKALLWSKTLWSLVGLVEASPLLSQRGAVEAFHFCPKKRLSDACSKYGETLLPKKQCEPLPLRAVCQSK